MKELEPTERPFWQLARELRDVQISGVQVPARLRVHTAEENYYRPHELTPLSGPRGERVYVHAQACVVEPRVTLTVACYDYPKFDGSIGEVVATHVAGTQERPFGKAQAWYYPRDRVVVLWECFLHRWCTAPNPQHDELLIRVWTSFEQLLQETFPDAERIVTPAHEPIYATMADKWEAFLADRGFEFLGPGVYHKLATAAPCHEPERVDDQPGTARHRQA